MRLALSAALLLSVSLVHAFEAPKNLERDTVAVDQMMLSMGEVARAFGPDAVILQTALLNEAVRNGSILEAKVEAPSYEQREGRKYVIFTLESGIVYNDRDVDAEQRARRTWNEIVAAALRRLTQFELKAEGMAVNVGYHHRLYGSERELRQELPGGRGEAEIMTYILTVEDAGAIAKGTLQPEQALGRALVLRSGEAVELK